jgi:excisionase family DNA binding protein
MRAVLDITDAAYYLHLREGTIRALVKVKQIPYRQLGRKLVFLVAELDAWADALPGVRLQDVVIPAPPVRHPRPRRRPVKAVASA